MMLTIIPIKHELLFIKLCRKAVERQLEVVTRGGIRTQNLHLFFKVTQLHELLILGVSSILKELDLDSYVYFS